MCYAVLVALSHPEFRKSTRYEELNVVRNKFHQLPSRWSVWPAYCMAKTVITVGRIRTCLPILESHFREFSMFQIGAVRYLSHNSTFILAKSRTARMDRRLNSAPCTHHDSFFTQTIGSVTVQTFFALRVYSCELPSYTLILVEHFDK